MTTGHGAGRDFRARVVAALPRLRRFCEAMAGGPHDGDDLMQATVERALTRQDRFDPATRIESWMFRIAQNLHIDRVRAARRRGTSVEIEEAMDLTGDDGRAVVEGRSDLDRVHAVLAELSEDQRATFLLVVIEEMTYAEAAETLGVPIGTIMSRIARARARINASLRPEAEMRS
ncbi:MULTISPECIES: RNA polymerase sigma factor [Novosphingobium]|uniref:RNA polymerase sigma factor n=1 Tax=Novosphingobium TaxID=165696 RepID=UPI001CD29C8A|nr:RNA polymerase sigma factor [Novosphingobium percolationis]